VTGVNSAPGALIFCLFQSKNSFCAVFLLLVFGSCNVRNTVTVPVTTSEWYPIIADTYVVICHLIFHVEVICKVMPGQ